MSVIKVTLPPGEIPAEGKMVSFKAPCTCTVTDGIEIEGVTYTVCDALGKCVTGVGGVWDTGSVVTVVLSLEQRKAYVQNNAGYSPSNKPTPADVGAAPASHDHSAANITSGTLVVARGGTGLTASPSMLTNLGSTTAASVFAASPRPGVTGTLPVANGGTGATDAAGARTNLGAASTARYTATLSTSWTASGSYFYQDVSVSGILATDTPVVGVNPGSDNAANVNYSIGFSNVFRVTTSANSIRVWARAKPTVAIPIQIKVVR